MTTLDQGSLDSIVEAWLERDPDARTRDELQALRDAGDMNELQRRFSGRLQFGTAGLRGIVGAGPTRMNQLVIRETSAGLASYVADEVEDAAARGVVIAYDARPDSAQFARDAASVFLGAGFKVFLTAAAQPTPIGAFAVLHYGAAAGVVVTASHNPPQYNGYKVYWENGAQIIPPHDAGIAERIEAAATADIPWLDIDKAQATGQLQLLGDDFADLYCRTVVAGCTELAGSELAKISVAYTALHGVGASLAQQLLEASGVCEFASVASQHEPDGTFPTVAFPNPEEPGAMDAVIELARERKAMLACANDPDADRLAVAVRNDLGEYDMLTGDQIGVLLGNYCLQQDHEFTPIVCASMVSSRMLESVAKKAGATFFETLTGFKWLANVALKSEDDNHKFLFAYEEALGYALGQLVRDKDGLSALLAFVHMTAELTAAGRTIFDQLEELYRQHGLFLSKQQSIATEPGAASITDSLRANPPAEIGGQVVLSTKDLQNSTQVFADGRRETLDLYPGDVLVYYLADDSRVIVRPSGTEPKTKCYYEIRSEIAANAPYADALRDAKDRLNRLVAGHQASLPAG